MTRNRQLLLSIREIFAWSEDKITPVYVAEARTEDGIMSKRLGLEERNMKPKHRTVYSYYNFQDGGGNNTNINVKSKMEEETLSKRPNDK